MPLESPYRLPIWDFTTGATGFDVDYQPFMLPVNCTGLVDEAYFYRTRVRTAVNAATAQAGYQQVLTFHPPAQIDTNLIFGGRMRAFVYDDNHLAIDYTAAPDPRSDGSQGHPQLNIRVQYVTSSGTTESAHVPGREFGRLLMSDGLPGTGNRIDDEAPVSAPFDVIITVSTVPAFPG